jgi:hypothetical protein
LIVSYFGTHAGNITLRDVENNGLTKPRTLRLMVEVIAISKTFQRASACVYCGKKSPEVVLTLEHIIPKGLKGYLKLPGGSCTGCASITKKFEQIVLRTMFGEARIHIGMGWGRKKEQPLAATVKAKTGDGFKVTAIPIGEHPFCLAMVDLPPPGILWSLTKIERHEKLRVVFHLLQGDFQKRIEKIGSEVILEQIGITPEFHRMLAKIAHSYAMALIADIGDFRPVSTRYYPSRRFKRCPSSGCIRLTYRVARYRLARA